MPGVNAAALAVAAGAGIVLLFVLTGRLVERRAFLTEPILCLAAGIALGPDLFGIVVLDLADPAHRETLHVAAGIVAGLTIMNAALTLAPGFVRDHARSLLVVLLLGMPLLWAAATASLLVLGTGVAAAVLLGAILTPTDPVLSSTIVSGRVAGENVPKRLRDAILCESAINDGLALPFVLVGLLLLQPGPFDAATLAWRVLWEVVCAGALGATFGSVVGTAVSAARRNGVMETETMVPVVLALTALVLAGGHLLRLDALLAVFTAGLAFRRALAKDWADTRDHFNAFVDRIAAPLFFVLVGTVLPFGEWAAHAGVLLPAVALLLLARRLPAWLLIAPAAPVYRGWRERAFAGWFGPMGVASIFYATQAMDTVDEPLLWPLVSLAVAASVVVHGLTATPFSSLLHRKK